MTTLRRLWPQGGLWRHADFLKLWSAQTVSQFGSSVSQVALPLVAVVSLHASAFQVAAISTVEFLPFLLFTLPAGVWVDRFPRRPILVLADAVSYVWSSLFVFWIHRREVVPERTSESPSLRRELIDGVTYLLGHRYWRWISMSTATFNFFNNVAFAILIVYLVRRLGMSPLTIGITFSLASAGSLA